MIYAKKTITGYKEENSRNAGHVIMAVSEYEKLLDNIYKAEQEASLSEKKSDNRIKAITRDYEKKISELDNHCSDLQNKLKASENLNMNLRRICRERANSERGITPKKKHDGYIILRSLQYISKKQTRKKEDVIWKTVIQTPYTVTIPLKDIQPEIESYMLEVLCPELGCSPICWRYMASKYWEIEIETNDAVQITENRLNQH